MGQNSNRRQERQPLPQNNPLYKVWMLTDKGDIVESRSHYSFINRNNPKKCLEYTKNIHRRIEGMGYAWLIDNINNTLLEIWDSTFWREPTEYEYQLFNQRLT